VVVLIALLLYRDIKSVGRISLWLGVIVVGILLWIISSGLIYGKEPVHFIPSDSHFSFFSVAFFIALGNASVKTVYAYLGYYNVCHLGGEIINPKKNIPRSIFISIAGISILYLLLCTSVLKTLDINDAKTSNYIISDFFQQLYGVNTANLATGLILLIAFASLFAVTLGYSRVPYAAAREGRFFKIFRELHPTKNIPHVSLFLLCVFAFVFSLLFKLKDVIQAILAMRILVQFIGQAVGLMNYHAITKEKMPFKMWLYPVPCILSVLVWIYLFGSTGEFALYSLGMIAAGLVVYIALFAGKKPK
jgi:amino acid transporter